MTFGGLKILVTGGAGFIGSRLVGRLQSLGAAVTIVDDLLGNPKAVIPKGTTLIKMRLPDPAFPGIVAQGGFETIFHLAGKAYVPPSLKDPIDDLKGNTEATLHVLEAIRTGSPSTRLIFISSAAVYGNPEKLPISESDATVPVSPYGVSKLAAETYVSLYARLHKLRTASLRFFSVYGPGQRKQVVFDMIKKLRGNPSGIEVHGTGRETRDFIYVDDAVGAILSVVTGGDLKGEVYNTATGTGTTLKQLVETLAGLLGAGSKIIYTGNVRPGDPLMWVADISQIRALGFNPQMRLEDGLKKVCDWYLSGIS